MTEISRAGHQPVLEVQRLRRLIAESAARVGEGHIASALPILDIVQAREYELLHLVSIRLVGVQHVHSAEFRALSVTVAFTANQSGDWRDPGSAWAPVKRRVIGVTREKTGMELGCTKTAIGGDDICAGEEASVSSAAPSVAECRVLAEEAVRTGQREYERDAWKGCLGRVFEERLLESGSLVARGGI